MVPELEERGKSKLPPSGSSLPAFHAVIPVMLGQCPYPCPHVSLSQSVLRKENSSKGTAWSVAGGDPLPHPEGLFSSDFQQKSMLGVRS